MDKTYNNYDLSKSFYTYIAGITKENRQAGIKELRIGQELTLIRESDNKFDNNAIAIYCGSRYSLNKMGYIPKDIAQMLSQNIDSGDMYDCEVKDIKGIYGTNNLNTYGVEVNVLYIKKTVSSDDYDSEEESWTAKDFNEYFTGDSDNNDWEFPDN